MLEHLNDIDFEPDVLDGVEEDFVSVKKATPAQMLDGQVNTSDWLKKMGAVDEDEAIEESQKFAASNAFQALALGDPNSKQALANVKTSAAVQQVVNMLGAYEWQFVEEAQKIRSMAVAKLVEETEHPDARIRLKAIEILGKVTEIGLFTERIEVKKADMPDHELDARIKEKLLALQRTVDEPKDIELDEEIEDVEVKGEDDESTD